jgi:hypothetical protein
MTRRNHLGGSRYNALFMTLINNSGSSTILKAPGLSSILH